MQIRVDAEGRKAIEEMVDVALRTGGIRNFNRVGKILEAVEMIEEPPQSETGE